MKDNNMDYKKQATKLARAIISYRKNQAKLVKLRSKPPHPKNVDPVKNLLTKINYQLADMEKLANEILTPINNQTV
jgi:hypothetical protein